MSETLDRSRRYLRPVARLPLEGQPDDTHWAVYEWLPQFEAWATGPAICGYSTKQGPLPEGTAVTCQRCEDRRPDYERFLAPGYRSEDDDPKALRRRLEEAQATLSLVRAEVVMLCECCGYNRERMARIRRELGLDVEGLR